MTTKKKADEAKTENQAPADEPLTEQQKQDLAFEAAKNPPTMELRPILAASGRWAIIGRQNKQAPFVQVAAIVGEENAVEYLRQNGTNTAVFDGAKPPEEWGNDAPLNMPRV